ncbi:MAG: Gfo/Idh/MocA family oxidoreductase [Bacteroidota bacterium]
MSESRRTFIKKSAAGTSAILAGGVLPGFSAESYRRIAGSNERIRVSVMGVNSRGKALAMNFARQQNCEVAHICDVDKRAIEACQAALNERQTLIPRGLTDVRSSLESKDIDALVIAAPDHWHAPASLMAMKAGKHVYVEKPCSHNPREGEILVEAAKTYGKVVQMGSQRRAWPNVIEAISALKEGVIGRPYFARGWYANNRGPINLVKGAPVPDWLDWELWQGPAPRRPYAQHLVHYNWHWFWHWGTGEALNNGTHLVDLMRWGLDVDYPAKVSSNGGRYRYKDDWETPDTQIINMEFPEGVAMSWEGRSCNGKHSEGNPVGVLFYGETGSLLITAGNSYSVFDLNNKLVKEVKDEGAVDPLDRQNPAESLDALHIRNFFDGIRNRGSLYAPIDSGHKSTLLVQLGNISQRVGHSLELDPENGHILNNPEANRYWERSYEPGWEMIL